MAVTKVFYQDAPTCPECGNKMVWDEDEQCWYCLNCSYWEEEEEEEEEWEDPYSCLGTCTPGVEECEMCPMFSLCEELTDNSWVIDEEENGNITEKERDGHG